ncbi:MAG: chromate transporter [Treponema sp.]|nr:chromate transporter [Treponema sp.]
MKTENGKLKTLWELFSIFFKIGLCTFGGGYAMLPILERELADKRGWTTSDELLDYFAIGQTTPGIIAVNVATFIGYKRAKTLGGIVATAGIVCPSLIIITVIAKFISNFSEIAWVQRALTGINVAVAALLTYAVANFAKKAIKTLLGVGLLLISFVLIFVFKISTIWIIFGSCLFGIILAGTRGEFSKNEANND